jgi:hypothetical protein
MRELSEKLEEVGNLTPIGTFRRFDELSNELTGIVSQIRGEVTPMPKFLRQLKSVRDGFGSYLGNEKAEYYDSFKSKYDFCQLLLGLWADERFSDYLDAILNRRDRFEPRSTASFFEIRPSDRQPRHKRLG